MRAVRLQSWVVVEEGRRQSQRVEDGGFSDDNGQYNAQCGLVFKECRGEQEEEEEGDVDERAVRGVKGRESERERGCKVGER